MSPFPLTISLESIILAVSILLLFGVLASKASVRLGIPALVLFLLIGMFAGSEGPGGIEFDYPRLAQSVGVVALIFILFAGGIDTDWRSVRPILWQAVALSTLGVGLTAVLVAAFAVYALDFNIIEGLLLGSIVSSTDAAAVFAVLRSRNVSLRAPLKPLLELESGSNDPMAVFLTIGFVSLLTNRQASLMDLLPMFALQMPVGMALGWLMGKGSVLVINRAQLEYDGLYPVLSLSAILLTYGLTNAIGGNGFLAVYIAGLVMGNSRFVHRRSLMRFHDGLAWLMQIAMFLVLGLQVFPSRIIPIIGIGLLISLFLMLVARPISVFLILAFTRMSLKEKTLVSWVGLRGAVPIILATFPVLAAVPQAEMIFHVVFFIVVTSVLLQGTSLPMVARWLGLESPLPSMSEYLLPLESPDSIRTGLTEITISSTSTAAGKQIVDLGLPNQVVVMMVGRNNHGFIPTGRSVLHANDKLLVFADKDQLAETMKIMEAHDPYRIPSPGADVI
ncbi:MAG TPA: potassium/proton antiporter [Nitrospiraceae bacterium]|nr:potassium/proton antiporter [Nitrospiraceae bacterium]